MFCLQAIFGVRAQTRHYAPHCVTMGRQCLFPHMELISIDAINSIRIKSLIFSPALGWSRSRGWMSTKAINCRHEVPLPWKPIWKVSSPICCIPKPRLGQTQGWHWTLQPEPIPVLVPKLLPILQKMVTPGLGCCHGADQAEHPTQRHTWEVALAVLTAPESAQPCSHLQHLTES